jgi:hypothetical protein
VNGTASNMGSQLFNEVSSYNSRLPLIKQVMNYQSLREKISNQNSNIGLNTNNNEFNLSVEKNISNQQLSSYEGLDNYEQHRKRASKSVVKTNELTPNYESRSVFKSEKPSLASNRSFQYTENLASNFRKVKNLQMNF